MDSGVRLSECDLGTGRPFRARSPEAERVDGSDEMNGVRGWAYLEGSTGNGRVF